MAPARNQSLAEWRETNADPLRAEATPRPGAPNYSRCTDAESDSRSPAVELRGVSVRYKGVAALNGIDLAIRQGEFFSLLGSSGCGKTSTLNVIGGFVEPDAGDLLIEGRSMRHVPAHQRPSFRAMRCSRT